MAKSTISPRDFGKPVHVPTGEPHLVVVQSYPAKVLEVDDLHFRHDSAVLQPDAGSDGGASAGDPPSRTALDLLRACLLYAKDNPSHKLLVTGHTDSSLSTGGPGYNLGLSQLRANNILALLARDPDGWADSCTAKSKVEDQQAILAFVAQTMGWPCDPGAVDGIAGPGTRGAIRAFQKNYNDAFDKSIGVDGQVGRETWKAFFDVYMFELAKLLQTDDDGLKAMQGALVFVDGGHRAVGCGDAHPIERTPDPAEQAGGAETGFRSETNRRVELLFFEPAHLPKLPCHAVAGQCNPAKCEVYDPLSFTFVHVDCDPQPKLRSQYVLGLFEKVAAELEENEFLAWASSAYGGDVPLDAIRALRTALLHHAFVNAPIELVPGGPPGPDGAPCDGAYDDKKRVILVKKELPLQAETDPAAAGKLIVVLMHEFGHHVDNVLRNDFSTTGGDAPNDEGAVFAASIAGMHQLDEDRVAFAVHLHDGESHELAIEYADFSQAALEYLRNPEEQAEAKKDGVEFFDAGLGSHNAERPNSSFGHRSIETGLKNADNSDDPSPLFTDTNRALIYFGNWLRDFSQALDVPLLEIFKNRYMSRASEARDLVVELMDAWAQGDFDPKAKPVDHDAGPFKVTRAKLGVYRAEEHIDNPQGMVNGKAVDPDLRGTVSPRELVIDPATRMKAYIASTGHGFDTSADFVARSLQAAVAAGPNAEGFRLLGQGLHTLEDLYAHSNFVELALIALGNTGVYPWVGLSTPKPVSRKGVPVFPLVTGIFGSVDSQVSLIQCLGESLEKDIECNAGAFTMESVIALKLIKVVTPDGAKAIESLWAVEKDLESKYPDYANFLCNLTRVPKDWIREKFGAFVRQQSAGRQKLESAFFDDATSTAPTHSQLAKDHDDHPLHTIAAQCASSAVAEVGRVIKSAWRGTGSDADDVARAALQFFVHPADIETAASSAPGVLMQMIAAFAKMNPGVIGQLDFTSSKTRFLQHAENDRQNLLDGARAMYANNDASADRTCELLIVVA
jgi:hypothetical protein